MTSDQELRAVLKVAILVAAGVFAPQIIAGLRRIGYRTESEFNTVKWARGARLFGIALALFVAGLML